MTRALYRDHAKRLLDIVGATTALMILTPLLAAVVVAVFFQMGRPILFRQQRPGRFGKPFGILKFRTMRNGVDAAGKTLPDSERLTTFGRWLRSTSIDELPELINVLRGDMSLVGPRPLLMEYLPLYSAEQRRRHDVRPGITGLAQVMGRNALNWERKFEADVKYVDSMSIALDLSIVFRSIRAVFRAEGITDGESATAKPFKGSS